MVVLEFFVKAAVLGVLVTKICGDICYFSEAGNNERPPCNGTFHNFGIGACMDYCKNNINCKGYLQYRDNNVEKCYSYSCSDVMTMSCPECSLYMKNLETYSALCALCTTYQQSVNSHPACESVKHSNVVSNSDCKLRCSFSPSCTGYKHYSDEDECFIFGCTGTLWIPACDTCNYNVKYCKATNCTYITHGEKTVGDCIPVPLNGISVKSNEDCFINCENDDYCSGVTIKVINDELRCLVHFCNTYRTFEEGYTFYSRSCQDSLPYTANVNATTTTTEITVSNIVFHDYGLGTAGNCYASIGGIHDANTLETCLSYCLDTFSCHGVTYINQSKCCVQYCSDPSTTSLGSHFYVPSSMHQICFYSEKNVTSRPMCQYSKSGKVEEDTCQDYCIKNENCTGYTYNGTNNQCYIYRCNDTISVFSNFYRKRSCSDYDGCTYYEEMYNHYPLCNYFEMVNDVLSLNECENQCNSRKPSCIGLMYSGLSCYLFGCEDLAYNRCSTCNYKKKHCKDTNCSYVSHTTNTVGDCIPIGGISVRSQDECFFNCENYTNCFGVTIQSNTVGLTCNLHWCNTSTAYLDNFTFYSRSCRDLYPYQGHNNAEFNTTEITVSGCSFVDYGSGTTGGCFPNIDEMYENIALIDCLEFCLKSNSCQGVTWFNNEIFCGVHNCSEPVVVNFESNFYNPVCPNGSIYNSLLPVESSSELSVVATAISEQESSTMNSLSFELSGETSDFISLVISGSSAESFYTFSILSRDDNYISNTIDNTFMYLSSITENSQEFPITGTTLLNPTTTTYFPDENTYTQQLSQDLSGQETYSSHKGYDTSIYPSSENENSEDFSTVGETNVFYPTLATHLSVESSISTHFYEGSLREMYSSCDNYNTYPFSISSEDDITPSQTNLLDPTATRYFSAEDFNQASFEEEISLPHTADEIYNTYDLSNTENTIQGSFVTSSIQTADGTYNTYSLNSNEIVEEYSTVLDSTALAYFSIGNSVSSERIESSQDVSSIIQATVFDPSLPISFSVEDTVLLSDVSFVNNESPLIYSTDDPSIITEYASVDQTGVPTEPYSTEDSPSILEYVSVNQSGVPIEPYSTEDSSSMLEYVSANQSGVPIEPYSTEDSSSMLEYVSANQSGFPIEPSSTEDPSSIMETASVNHSSANLRAEAACSCICKNVSFEEYIRYYAIAIESLKVNKTNISKTVRLLTSAKDERPTSKSVGATAVVIIVAVACTMITNDVINAFCTKRIKK